MAGELLAEATTGIAWRQGPALPAARPRTLAELHRPLGGGQPIVVDARRAWSAAELGRAAIGLAARWRERIGPGARIALLLGNGAAHLVVREALWRLGAVVAPLDPTSAPEIRQELLRRLAPDLVIAAGDAPDGDALLHLAQGDDTAPWHEGQPDDPCLILFTSGSSGRAKAVVLSQDNLCSQQTAFALLWPEAGPGERLASYLPWHHSFGALAECLWARCRGMAMHLVPGDGHDHAAFLSHLHSVRPTRLLSVPRMHRILCRSGLLPTLPELRWVFTAGAALGAAEEAAYAAAGIQVVEGWGLTETSPSCTITRPSDPRRPGLVGHPLPGVAIGIAGDARILVRGPNVMLGYLDDPAATAEILGDGVLDSGDRGRWSDAGLELLGRGDLLLKLENGERVDAGALAECLLALPGIRHALVFVHQGRLAALLDADLPIPTLRAMLRVHNAAEPLPWQRLRFAWRRRGVWDDLLTPSQKIGRASALTCAERHPERWETVLGADPA